MRERKFVKQGEIFPTGKIATILEVRQVLDGLHDANLPLKVLFLGLDEVAVALFQFCINPAHVAPESRFPSVALAQ